ncbi:MULTISPECIES: ATP-dependent helicase [unclassified Leifsonia]|uniref:ATP-dependent helicase n=1 Tax=unclassified Leifsonia TaxID=2663824 RepID=UPI0006FF8EB9|nr:MULTISPECIES: ATP-dependent helicase [unclassified Leifsonia]KQX05720.1 DEAD/DEAH box helicase [Leifsonia sp. Root1293]KRA09356.1 DEAD/DEAH box helicase [Leifsonia sp. Root60]
MGSALDRFSPATRTWFDEAFSAPTLAQSGAWDAIGRGSHALVVAPTGSGKTLAAFLSSLDALHAKAADDEPGTRVLYISPLKALGVDVERNLRAPLVGIARVADRLGIEPPHVSVGVRSGDTPAADRRTLQKSPPDILITTPESLFLMLTSAARDTLRTVETVIVDEIHAVAGTKRGAHLAVSLERLDDLLDKPAQRIGLSATVRPPEEVARFLCASAPVEIVAPASEKRFDLRVVVPVDDMADLPPAPEREGATSSATPQTGSIWPHVEEAIVDRVLENRSSIVFANSRRLAERLTARLNEIYAERTGDAVSTDAGPPAALMGQAGQMQGAEPLLARAHHGSVSKEQRAEIEDDLKSGRLRCVVATSSLELGIDMGAVDLVVQVESPPSVASGLQRVGRAGHQVGEVSRGVIFPKHRADLVHAAVTAERMLAGAIETLHIPANPLDILAQQTVAAVALDQQSVDGWFDTVRRSAPFSALPRSAYEATLDLLAGRYPSDQFAELRPRIVWDREAGVLTGRPGAQRLAVTSGGTIPDRGMFGVFLVGGDELTGRRVGELDEEMVYESRVGDVFALGATSWRIQEITHDRVNVTPAFGQPGRLPFWKGDSLGRPAELGRALGQFMRDVSSATDADARSRIRAGGLDDRAATNLIAFLTDQRAATGQVPTDRTLVVERVRDELGDWRVILHSPYGMNVHAPWALAVSARVRERHGIDGASIASDDGIIVRIPDTGVEPPGAELFVFEADELEQLVTDEVGGSALFASRFRECAARALLLPHYRPGTRSPLWQQRQKSAQLLDVARTFPTFPIILETLRECLQDVYDLPSLLALAREIGSRGIRLVETTTDTPSPFASTLLFGYVGAFMYEGDSPLAERRAAALAIDSTLLAELLGRVELRELLDPAVIDDTERELQRLAPDRRAKGIEGIADLLRGLGALSVEEISARVTAETLPDVAGHIDELLRTKRIVRTALAGADRLAAIEDVGRLRDALGVPIQVGVPEAYLEAVADPLGDLISRYARTHGPFATEEVAERLGIGTAVARSALRRLVEARRLVEGEFRPNGTSAEWCDAEVLRRLRRRSLAALRHEIEPVEQRALARFLPVWQHVGGRLRGLDGVASVIEQLEGARLPASAWESLVLPARVSDYSPAMLDELMATGEVVWCGSGALAGDDGWISLHLADTAALTLPISLESETTPLQREVLASLGSGGAFFFRQLADAVGSEDDSALVEALWDLAWSGLVTNDTFAPVRALVAGGHSAHKPQRAAPRARMHRGRALPRAKMPSRGGPPTVAGRWSILPLPDGSATRRAHALGETLLERYGVVTRGAAVAEGVIGGFALVYRTLREFEESGRSRRGYFVDKLGAAQFAAPGAVDRLRSHVDRDDGSTQQAPAAFTLAATDPANPFGAALAWPALPEGTAHRPARKAGALVVLVDGTIALYVERGGKTMLAFTDDETVLTAAATSLAAAVSRGGMRKLAVETVNGLFVLGAPAGLALRGAGFSETPRGLRLSARV